VSNGLVEAAEEHLLRRLVARPVVQDDAPDGHREEHQGERDGDVRPRRPGQRGAQAAERAVQGGERQEDDVRGDDAAGDAVRVSG
jgi:hypothetical protein